MKKCSSCGCNRSETDFQRKNKQFKTCNACADRYRTSRVNIFGDKNDKDKHDSIYDKIFAEFDIDSLTDQQHDYFVCLRQDWNNIKAQMNKRILALCNIE